MLENHITVCVRGLALRAMALRRAWTLLESRKNSKPEKYLKTAQTPQRPVHAVLGGLLLCKTQSMKKDYAANLTKLLHEPLTLAMTKYELRTQIGLHFLESI